MFIMGRSLKLAPYAKTFVGLFCRRVDFVAVLLLDSWNLTDRVPPPPTLAAQRAPHGVTALVQWHQP